MREPGSAVRQILDASFSLLQITVHPVWQSASTQAIVSAVAEGLGVAVLPRMLVERDAKEEIVRMLPIDKPLVRELNIVYHRRKFLTRNHAGLYRALPRTAGKDGRVLGRHPAQEGRA